MKIYELNLHLSTKLDEKDRDAIWEKIKKIIDTEKGEILEHSPSRQIELAYPIKKEIYSFYGHLFFKALPETILTLGDLLLHEKTILRYLIFTHKSISKKPVSTRMSRRRERVGEEKKEESRGVASEIVEAETKPVNIKTEKPIAEKKRPVTKKKIVKKVKKETVVEKEEKTVKAIEKEKPKKEPKFKLEDIDKSLEKLLEKEL
ncbi:MAG: 30S ribosomal protein S6 [Candidatus Paceibacterota bacterium]|jgi:ribosomal protein S6